MTTRAMFETGAVLRVNTELAEARKQIVNLKHKLHLAECECQLRELGQQSSADIIDRKNEQIKTLKESLKEFDYLIQNIREEDLVRHLESLPTERTITFSQVVPKRRKVLVEPEFRLGAVGEWEMFEAATIAKE